MKSVSKPSSARLRRPAPANGAITSNRRHKARIASEAALADVMDDHWDASEKEFDLADLDYDSIDDSEDAAGGDWLADRDLALEIAQRALH